MEHQAKSIRPFIGATNFGISRSFYCDLGFNENVISSNLSVFTSGSQAFYLQDYYAKEWIDNTMVFMEVDNAAEYYQWLVSLDLPSRYENVRVVPLKTFDWGRECFMHDPSGVLWHFGEFF